MRILRFHGQKGEFGHEKVFGFCPVSVVQEVYLIYQKSRKIFLGRFMRRGKMAVISTVSGGGVKRLPTPNCGLFCFLLRESQMWTWLVRTGGQCGGCGGCIYAVCAVGAYMRLISVH